jgi:putative heme-binding domain-containing protein
MQREGILVESERLARWLGEETDAIHVAAIVDAMKGLPPGEVRRLSASVIAAPQQSQENRLAALLLFTGTLREADGLELLQMAERLEDGPVLAAVLTQLALRPEVVPQKFLFGKLASGDASVRAAAISALSTLKSEPAKAAIAALLNDIDATVRRAAVVAAGELEVAAAADRVLELARDADAPLRRACLITLRRLGDGRAVEIAVDALSQRDTLPAALQYLADFGGPDQESNVTRIAATNLDADVHAAVVGALSLWLDRAPQDSSSAETIQRAIARVQGAHGLPLHWRLIGPLSSEQVDGIVAKIASAGISAQGTTAGADDRYSLAAPDGRIQWPNGGTRAPEDSWLAVAEVLVDEAADVEFLASSNGTLAAWVNQPVVFQRDKPGAFQPDSDRFAARLESGLNTLVIRVASVSGQPVAQLRFRRRSSKVEHERLIGLVLGGGGNVDRGREVFKDVERSLCLKCHRLGAEGGRIGPDLTGIGRRYSRVHILESILQPSRTIAPSYESVAVALTSGQVLTGVKVGESAATLTLGDNLGKTHEIPRGAIDDMRVQTLSTMPEGLETKLTDQQFVDLVAFLAAQKE